LATQRWRGSGVPVGGTPGAEPDAIQTRRVVHVRRAAIEKINVRNRTDIQAYLGDGNCRGALWRFAGTKKKTMKCLTILCLSLGLAGCYWTGPYASANGTGPVVDLSACAESTDLRVDPLCHPLTRTQLK
jgi:hypothetical protein